MVLATTEKVWGRRRKAGVRTSAFLLVDGGTFASAALGMLVGEPVGASTTFNGGEFDIPIANLDWRIHAYASLHHITNKGCATVEMFFDLCPRHPRSAPPLLRRQFELIAKMWRVRVA